MSQWHGGKGSKPRKVTDQDQFDSNWDLIFGKKDQKVKQAMVTDLNWDGEEEEEPKTDDG